MLCESLVELQLHTDVMIMQVAGLSSVVSLDRTGQQQPYVEINFLQARTAVEASNRVHRWALWAGGLLKIRVGVGLVNMDPTTSMWDIPGAEAALHHHQQFE